MPRLVWNSPSCPGLPGAGMAVVVGHQTTKLASLALSGIFQELSTLEGAQGQGELDISPVHASGTEPRA